MKQPSDFFQFSRPNFLSRELYPIPDKKDLQIQLPLIGGAVILYLLTLAFRSWPNLIHPGMYMEDATHYFNIYYGGNRDLSFILQHPNGYYNILNNLVAWLSSKLDVRMVTWAYHLFSLTTGIVCAVLFLFTGLIKNRLLLLITPIVLGLSGMNHIYYYTSLTFQMYNVVIILLILLFLPGPESFFSLVCKTALATLLIWSGPYSVVAVPVSLVSMVMFKGKYRNIWLMWVIICSIGYSLSVQGGMIRLATFSDAGARHSMISTLFTKIFFMDMLGSLSTYKMSIFLLIIVAIFLFLRKNSTYLKISILLFGIIIGSLAPLFLSVKYLLYQQVFPCHIYIAQFFWLVFVLYTIDQFMPVLKKTAHFFPPAVVAAILCFVLADNLKHPAKGKREIMTNLPDFLATIHRVEQLSLIDNNQYVVLKTNNIIPKGMHPMVRVGSLRHDARRLRRSEVKISKGKEFIID